jgi:hypothetical protein
MCESVLSSHFVSGMTRLCTVALGYSGGASDFCNLQGLVRVPGVHGQC